MKVSKFSMLASIVLTGVGLSGVARAAVSQPPSGIALKQILEKPRLVYVVDTNFTALDKSSFIQDHGETVPLSGAMAVDIAEGLNRTTLAEWIDFQGTGGWRFTNSNNSNASIRFQTYALDESRSEETSDHLVYKTDGSRGLARLDIRLLAGGLIKIRYQFWAGSFPSTGAPPTFFIEAEEIPSAR